MRKNWKFVFTNTARLQGFPDDFQFCGSQGDKYRMIGNAVPPHFSKLVAEALYQLLKDC